MSVQPSSIRSADVSLLSDDPGDLGVDQAALKEQLVNTPFGRARDVKIEGDWVVGKAAAQKALMEYVRGQTVNINIEEVQGMSRIQSVSSPAGAEGDFGAGDSSVTVGVGNGYYIDNPGWSNSTTLYSGSGSVLQAGEGERAVAWNPPNGEVAFLIGQNAWGYQFSAAAALLTSLPSMGVSGKWRVPAFGTADGSRSLSAAYTYSTLFPLAAPLVQYKANVSTPRAETMTVAVRQPNGEKATSSTIDLDEGTNSVSLIVVNAPSAGLVEFHVPGTNFAVSDTSMMPPSV